MHISLIRLGEGPVLAGSLTGRRVLAMLLDQVRHDPPTPEPVFLDFDHVEIATASFLREGPIEFRDTVRRRSPKFYPVIANANTSVREELSFVIARSRTVLMLCSLPPDGRPHTPSLVGDLEPTQAMTLDLVRHRGETDARELAQTSHASDAVGHTAWNNRLSSLAKLGLLIETRPGRTKRYRPLLMEQSRGT